MKRLALDKDGNMTICVAKPGNEGQFGCTHVMHQKDGQNMEDFVEQMNEISFNQYEELKKNLKKKLRLSINLSNENFEDKVSLIEYIRNYPGGITKSELIILLENKGIEPITEETYRKLVNSSNNFKPAEVVDDTIIDYVNLINGLSNKNIGNNMVFINGRWQPK